MCPSSNLWEVYCIIPVLPWKHHQKQTKGLFATEARAGVKMLAMRNTNNGLSANNNKQFEDNPANGVCEE